jgi:hypothetical protein
MEGSFTTGGPLHREFFVCEAHGERLAGGEDYRLDPGQRAVVLLGCDLAGLDEWLADSWTVEQSSLSPAAKVRIKTKRLGSEETGEVEFWLTPAKREDLAASLTDPLVWDFGLAGGGTFERLA